MRIWVVSTGGGPVAAYDSFSAARKYAASLKAAGVSMVTVKSVNLHGVGAM